MSAGQNEESQKRFKPNRKIFRVPNKHQNCKTDISTKAKKNEIRRRGKVKTKGVVNGSSYCSKLFLF